MFRSKLVNMMMFIVFVYLHYSHIMNDIHTQHVCTQLTEEYLIYLNGNAASNKLVPTVIKYLFKLFYTIL